MSPISNKKMGHKEHKERAPKVVKTFVISISDTRTEAEDKSGAFIKEELAKAGHEVLGYKLLRDNPVAILNLLNEEIAKGEAQAFVLTGGTGISTRDSTFEAVRRLIDKEIEGFGELFRMLSYGQIGANALMSRAVGGLVSRPPEEGGDTFLFALPGSSKAVELGVKELVAPQLGHLVWLRKERLA